MSAAIRTNSLTLSGSGDKSLSGMSKHGQRKDRTSEMRRVRDVEPLVYGSLELREAYEKHVDGCRASKGLKRPVLHSLVQFPTSIKITEANQKKMLDLAVKFINQTHGGDAVFAARLDRDEAGQHTVDVFYSPKYKKVTKSHGEQLWISTTKHGKELCEVHREEIENRNHAGKFVTNPRAVGIAIQTEFRSFLLARGLDLPPKKEKNYGGPDRLSPEAYKLDQEYKKRKVASKENAALRRALVMLHDKLEAFEDLIPSKVWNLISKLKAQADRASSAGPDPSVQQVQEVKRQSPGASQPGPPQPGR
jgi:hypothetical protein